VMMTELDLNMLPNPKRFGGAEVSQHFQYDKSFNPYVKGLTRQAQKMFNERYLAFFKIYKKHADQISRVTLWGLSDGDSWLNGWPIPGRTNYSLLIDRQYKLKPIVKDIIKLFEQ
jgi:endo-1,4-beta-xylanase A